MGKPTLQSAYAKTKAQISFAVTAKLISAFVFATRIVQFFYFLNPKFPFSSHLLCLYSPDCVGPVRKPHCWFSHEAAQIKGGCIFYFYFKMFVSWLLLYLFICMNYSQVFNGSAQNAISERRAFNL